MSLGWDAGCAVSERGDRLTYKERLFVIREWKAWAAYVLQGCTYANTLGFRSSTVEYALMRGETGGDSQGQPKVPTHFNLDRNVETLCKVFSDLSKDKQEIVAGVFLWDMKERRVALVLGIPENNVYVMLWEVYGNALESLDK